MGPHPSDTAAPSGGGPRPGAEDLGRPGEGAGAAGQGDEGLPFGSVSPFFLSSRSISLGRGVCVMEEGETYTNGLDWIGGFFCSVDRLTVLALQIRPSYVLHHAGESYEVEAITIDLVDGIIAFHSSVMVHVFQTNHLCKDHGYRFIWPNARCAM